MKLKTVFTISGAFAAYNIGAGFATGQETIQYFGSYGGIYPFVLPIFTFVLMGIFCVGTYRAGYVKRFSDPNMAYTYFCGKKLGKCIDFFCTISIALSTLVMFAGSGATIKQYLGLPVWVGTLVMGIISVIVVCLGLEKVTNVLGGCGIVIIIIIAIAGIYSFCTTPVGIMEAQQHVLKYVEEGIILQGQFLGITNPFLANLFLVGAYITLALVFNTTLGNACKNKKEVFWGAFFSVLFFIIGLIMVLFTILLNLDYIAEIKAQVPMLAAIENRMPFLAMPFSVVILVGVFTTITGYLWAVGRRFAEDRTRKQRIIVIVVAVIGVTIASVIPLSDLVNTIFPLIGVAGVVLLIGIIFKMITDRGKVSPTSIEGQCDCAEEDG